MKNSMIRDMFLGKRGCCESIELSDSFKSTSNKLADAFRRFERKLTTDLKEEFDELSGIILEYNALLSEDHFVDGFKMGILMGIEVNESGECEVCKNQNIL